MSDARNRRWWWAAGWRVAAMLAAVLASLSARADTLVPWADSTWRYVVVGHGEQAGFEAVGFDDSAWATGRAPFGSGNYCNWPSPEATDWAEQTDLLARMWLHVDCPTEDLVIQVAIDNRVQVWVNGMDVSNGGVKHHGCAFRGSHSFTVPRRVLVQGDNLVAVRARDDGGPSYFDSTIAAFPSVSASPDYTPVFSGLPDSVQLRATLLNSFPCLDSPSWQWQRRDRTIEDPSAPEAWVDLVDGNEFQGTHTNVLTVVRPTADLATAYRCKVASSCVCAATGGVVRHSNEANIGWLPNAIGWRHGDPSMMFELMNTPENRVLEQVAINDWGIVGLSTDGSILSWNRDWVPSGRFVGVTASFSGGFYGLREDGSVFGWGSVQPLCGGRFRMIRGAPSRCSLGITLDGRLAAFASDDCRVSLPSGRFIDVALTSAGPWWDSSNIGYAIREDGTAIRFPLWTDNADAGVVELFPGVRFIQVQAGGWYSTELQPFAVFLADDGSLWSDGGVANRLLPQGRFKAIAGNTAWHWQGSRLIAIRTDGSLVEWLPLTGQLLSTPATPPGGYDRVFAGLGATYALTTPGCGSQGLIAFSLHPSGVSVAPLTSVTFSVSTNGPPPGLYEWRKNGISLANGGRLSGVDGPVLSIASVRAEDQGRYDCVVAEGPACQRTTSAIAELSCRPVFLREPANAVIAGGQSVLIDVEVTGFVTSLQWRKDGVPLRDSASYSGVNTATLWITGNDPNQSGSYDLVAVNACGSTTSAKATIVVTDGSGPACPGDLNSDGGVDGADLFLFFENWEQGC